MGFRSARSLWHFWSLLTSKVLCRPGLCNIQNKCIAWLIRIQKLNTENPCSFSLEHSVQQVIIKQLYFIWHYRLTYADVMQTVPQLVQRLNQQGMLLNNGREYRYFLALHVRQLGNLVFRMSCSFLLVYLFIFIFSLSWFLEIFLTPHCLIIFFWARWILTAIGMAY